MSNPLHAAHYADHALQQIVEIRENVLIARDTFRLRIDCPDVARRIVPGQFLMLRLAGYDDPLIARPLALYDTVLSPAGSPLGVDVVYLVAGRFTRRLAHWQPGQKVEVWGPLGNGFAPVPGPHPILVAGGIGMTPFLALAQELLGGRRYGDPPREASPASSVTLCYGSRTASMLAAVDEFRQLGVVVHLATDDGSAGHHGFVTDLLQQQLRSGDRAGRSILCCGPQPMMQIVSEIAARERIPCQVSLETPMACGIGICFTCVAKVREADGTWDYKRTCVEGPVFDSRCIVW